MKYQNIIILSVIILIVGILIYRWYFKSEGFFGLSNDDKLIDTTEISTYDYLWSNNLYLEQFPKDNPPENLIIFQKPKNNNSATPKQILGTMVTDSLDKLGKKSTVVSKDVKSPTELKEIFKFATTSEPIFNKLLTYESLMEFKKRNDAVLNTLETSINEFDEIFTSILSKINEQLTITLFQNSLGETGEVKLLVDDGNGNLTYTLSNGIYNAFKFPIGSKVNITTRNGQQYEIYIPVENMIDNNGIPLDNDTINYDKIFQNTGLNQHSYNPFGSYGLGWKNYLENKEQLHKNANRMFNYNYGIGLADAGLTEKSNLVSFIKSNNVETDTITAELANSGMNNCIKIGNKIFFVDHVVKINRNDENYLINAKRNIVRNVYKYGSPDGYDSKTGCKSTNTTKIDDDYIGKYNATHCDNSTKIKSGRDTCIRGRRRVWCANGKPGETVIFSDSYQKDKVVKQIYVNREWINFNEYSSYLNVNNTPIPAYPIIIKYGSRENYNVELTKTGYTIYNAALFQRRVNGSYENQIPYQLFIMTSLNDLFDIHKRNILACLWHDGEVTFENYENDSDGSFGLKCELIFDTDNNQGPKYSPYVTIAFANKGEAKNFVANILNKMQNAAIVAKFRNPTIVSDNVELTNIQTTQSTTGNNNMDQIKQNIIDVLENYNRYADESQDIDDNTMGTIKSQIEDTINGFSSEISLYYFNFMMTLPKFKLDGNGNTIREGAFNLVDGTYVDDENNSKIRNMTVTINQNDNPIYKVLVTNINKIRTELEGFRTHFIANSSKYDDLINQIINKQLSHYPIIIHRPIAPPKYKALGDIVEITGYTDDNSSEAYNINPKNNLEQYGCVPEHCVVEARPWLVSDKVYEYNEGGKYLAIFRNPYLNTFRAVTQFNATPEGSVEKIVACVAKSSVVDDLKHSDKCAAEYKRGYQANVNNNNLDRDNILFDKQEARLQNMLAERQNTIDNLKKNIAQVQKQDRQAIVINHSMNRKRFQDLLDKQVYNMDELITNLYSVISINVNMKELITRLKSRGITQSKIQEIIDTIKKTDNTYTKQPTITGSSNIDDVTTEDGNPPDGQITEPAKLQRIIYRTRDGREQEMILRSLVESSCGCYFTDDEVIKTR